MRELEALLSAAQETTDKLERAASASGSAGRQDVADSLAVLQAYRAGLDHALRSGTAETLLKASNRLTTVNKGVADLFSLPGYEELQRSASHLTDVAIAASKCLRGA